MTIIRETGNAHRRIRLFRFISFVSWILDCFFFSLADSRLGRSFIQFSVSLNVQQLHCNIIMQIFCFVVSLADRMQRQLGKSFCSFLFILCDYNLDNGIVEIEKNYDENKMFETDLSKILRLFFWTNKEMQCNALEVHCSSAIVNIWNRNFIRLFWNAFHLHTLNMHRPKFARNSIIWWRNNRESGRAESQSSGGEGKNNSFFIHVSWYFQAWHANPLDRSNFHWIECVHVSCM